VACAWLQLAHYSYLLPLPGLYIQGPGVVEGGPGLGCTSVATHYPYFVADEICGMSGTWLWPVYRALHVTNCTEFVAHFLLFVEGPVPPPLLLLAGLALVEHVSSSLSEIGVQEATEYNYSVTTDGSSRMLESFWEGSSALLVVP